MTLLCASSAKAITVDISTGDLTQGIQDSLVTGDKLSKLISTEIMQVLDETGIKLEEGQLLFSYEVGETELNGGCLAATAWGNGNVRITEGSTLTFILEALNKPIKASADIIGELDAEGQLRVFLGTRIFGKCIRWGRRTSDFVLNADIAMNVDFELNLNAEKVTENGQDYIRMAPKVRLNGTFNKISGDADIDLVKFPLQPIPLLGLLDFGINIYANSELNSSEGIINGEYQDYLETQEAEWQSDINSLLGITSEGEYKYYKIPNIDYEKVKEIATLVNREFNSTFPVAIDYIDMHKRDILYYLLVGDREGLKDTLGQTAACQAATILQTNMANPKVYAYHNGSCSLADVTGSQVGAYYVDSSCSQSIPFVPEDFADFCRSVTAPDKDVLGNPDKWLSGQSSNWTVAPASRFDVTVDSIANNTQPLMKRTNYRTATLPAKYNYGEVEIPVNDRRYVFDLCVQVAASVSPVLVDPYNNIQHYVSCHPRNSMISKYNTANISSGINRILFDGSHYYAEWEDSIMGFNFVWQIDMYSDDVYNRAVNVIETYGVPAGIVTKTEAVNCNLEMRIYKKNYTDTNLKPLLAIHGGSWKYRGFGFYGLESQISHFTDEGYVVFAPFYRLAGESEGNDACNNYEWQDIVSDVEAALSWVKSNGSAYGMNANDKINLLGQSAGGHLAGWLVTNRPNDIAKAILMYTPTDVENYIENYKDGIGGSDQGASILGLFLGEGLSVIDAQSEAVQRNSFPTIIGNNPSAYPPVYLIHGGSDELVPASQSVRMCNAYAGSASYGPANIDSMQSGQVLSFNCGSGGSKLEVIADSHHGLEICVEGAVCAAGSAQGESQVRDAVIRSRNWLGQ